MSWGFFTTTTTTTRVCMLFFTVFFLGWAVLINVFWVYKSLLTLEMFLLRFLLFRKVSCLFIFRPRDGFFLMMVVCLPGLISMSTTVHTRACFFLLVICARNQIWLFWYLLLRAFLYLLVYFSLVFVM